MATDCKTLVEAYLAWLRDRISVAEIDGVCEITTPFLDRHNDQLQIYVEREGDRLRLTDDGYVIGDLQSSGSTRSIGEKCSKQFSMDSAFAKKTVA